MVAEQLAVRLESFIADRFTIGEHLRHEWAAGLINTIDSFTNETSSFHELYPDFQAINWIDSEGVIKWVTPVKGNQGAIGLELKKHPFAGPVLLRAWKQGEIQATGPIELAQGGKGFAVYIPLGTKKRPEGALNLVFRVAPLVQAALQENLILNYHYLILDDGKTIYERGSVDSSNPLTVQRVFSVADREWSISLTPTALALEGMCSTTLKIILLFALVISAGLSWIIWLYLSRQEELAVKSHILETTLANVDDGISVVDSNLNLVAFNERFFELLKFPPWKFKLGDPFEAFIRFNAERGEYGPGDVEEQICERVEKAKKFEAHVFERTTPDGTILEIRGNPMEEGGFVTSYTDITERKKAEEALRQSEERFAISFNSSPAVIVGIGDGILYDVNDHFCDATGYRKEEVIGTSSIAEIGLSKSFNQRRELVRILKRDGVIRDFEGTMIAKNGDARDWIFNGGIIDIDNDKKLLLVFHDVTERKRAEEKALHMAGHDPLTGLPNRNLMRDRLDHELIRAKRNNTKIAILFVDLNDFKLVNDRMGHKAGDHALQHITKVMKHCVRASDTIARFGGDEFVVIMPDVDDQTSVTSICEKLAQSLVIPFELDGVEVQIGASIGISIYPDHANTSEALLEMADKAMYDLKNADTPSGFNFFE